MKQAGSIAIAIALIASSVWLYRHFSGDQRQSQDFPEGAHWLCLKCNQGFSLSLKEVNRWANSEPAAGYPCPKCKAVETTRAKKCPLPGCGKFYVERNLVIDDKVCCPVCKKPLP
ncbi:MAG: hypothetical protein EXS31_12440 [Pedosphaera sp.]|nr:hypothetical protein [Pedosphaera sp.]